MSKNSIRIWLICSALLALGVAPFLARGDQATRQMIDQNRQAIANMTQSDRDQLDRNFAAYKKKSPQQITELETFHQTIEKDRQTNAGELARALEQYDRWLATIEPFQRNQLKETTDPQARIRLMSEIVREQQAREANSVFRRRFDRFGASKVPVLDRQQLLDFMQRVEEIETGKLTVPQKSELNRKDGISRFLILIKMLKENVRVPPQDRAKMPPWIDKELFVVFRELRNQTGRLIESESVKEYLAEERPEPRENYPVLRFQGVVLLSILEQVLADQEQPSAPAQSQLEQLFNSLPEDEQDALLQLEAIDFYKELVVRSEPVELEGDQVTPRDVFEVFKGPRDHEWFRSRGNRNPGENDGRLRPGDGDRDRGRGEFRDERGGPRRPFGRDEGPPPRRDDRPESGDGPPPR